MKKLLAFLVLGLLPSGASAQEAPVLTLADALRLARERNPEYRKVLNDLEVAEAQTRQSWGAFLPGLSASLGFSGSSFRNVTAEDDFGRIVDQPDPVTERSSTARQGADLSMTLFDGGRNFRNLRVARANERSTAALIRATESTLTLNVTQEFFRAVEARRLVEVEEANLATARDRLERTEAQFRFATTNRVEVLQATRGVVTAERQLASGRANADKARLQLATRIGLDSRQAFELSSELPPLFDPTSLDADALVERALSSSPTVLQRHAAVVTAENQSSAARALRWPSISGSFGYSRSMRRDGYLAWGDFNPRNYSFGFGLSASLPVFTRFQTSAQITRADADEEDAKQELRRTQLDVERAVRSALIDLQTAHRALELANENARISAEQVALAEELYRAGSDRYNFLELQRLVDDNQAAQRDAVNAEFQFILMRAALEEILGGPLDP